MKIKLSKSQWEMVGIKSGWMKKAQQVKEFTFPATVKIRVSYDQYENTLSSAVGEVYFIDGKKATQTLDISGDGRVSSEDFEKMIPQQPVQNK